MRSKALAVAVVLLMAIGALPSASAQSNTFTVDCSQGQKIGTALQLGDWRRPLVLNVRGTCREFVNIMRADVTLRGDPSAEIVAPSQDRDLLTVSGDRVTLENLTLTGGAAGLSHEHAPNFLARSVTVQDSANIGVRVRVGDARLAACTVQRSGGVGISVVRGGSVTLSGSNVSDSAREGINATRNSLVSLTGSTVMRSGTEGIVLGDGAQGSITRSTIADNAGYGIRAVGNSTVSANGGAISRNMIGVLLESGAQGNFSGVTISENTEIGIKVAYSQAIIADSNVSNNANWGIWVLNGSSAAINGNTIEDNGWDGVSGDIGSTLTMIGNQIRRNGWFGIACRTNCTLVDQGDTLESNASGGILIIQGSMLSLADNVTHWTGEGWGLYCGDKESSVGNAGMFDGTVSDTCTDFDN